MALIGEAANRMTQRQWQALSSLSGHLLDRLQGLTTLKLLGRSQVEIALLRQRSIEFRDRTMAVLRVAFLSALVLEWVATLSTAIVAVEIGLRLLSGNLGFESAFFVLLLAPEFYIPLRMLGLRFHAGAAGAAAAVHIFDVLEQQPLAQARGSLQEIPPDAAISFQNVYYKYPGAEHPALQNLGFTWKSGETLALVGPSGGGKSTIANLLLGFDQPTQGVILLNGVSLASFDPTAWREQIAWVPQNPYLFMDSVEENLRLANPQASQAAIIDACAQANALAFIERLPQGFQTMIGERGHRLSGGQAQRLALARAFLKNAPRIILDEATANLDPDTENRIHSAMQRLQVNRTTLIIAHRLTTTLRADRVLVLHQGRILESGNPRDLLKQQGAYWRMMHAYQNGIERGASS
jgi:ATP-binding cassette subfamily C protein CydD